MRRPCEGIVHITARSNAEEHIFRDQGDYLIGISVLAAAPCPIHMFCLMPTHYHVLASVTAGALSKTIHSINRSYAVAFNRRWKRHGHVFDSPTTTVPVVSQAQLYEVVRYIANNPADPDHWPYSSYPGSVELRPRFSFVDDEIVRSLFRSPSKLRDFVAEGRTPEPGSQNQVPASPRVSRLRSAPSGTT